MEHWEGEKFCLYCAHSKVTSNRGTPGCALTALVLTQVHNSTLSSGLCRTFCGLSPPELTTAVLQKNPHFQYFIN